jgi:ribose 5-phosphate isomerase B
MKIVIGSDHAGFSLKQTCIHQLQRDRHEVIDCGTNTEESCDYPDFAHEVACQVAADKTIKGILICGSGIGMSMAANRHPGIRAALCRNALEARLSREHNDANILVLGARLTGADHAADCLKTFLATDFAGGRHEQRVKKIDSKHSGETR